MIIFGDWIKVFIEGPEGYLAARIVGRLGILESKDKKSNAPRS